MPTFQAEAIIDKPAQQVWSALTDWQRAPQWMNGIEAMRADGETTEGTTLTFHSRGKERTSRVASLDPGKRLVLRSVQGGVTADYAYELHPQGDGATRVTLVAECRTRGIVWNLLSPLIGMAIRASDGRQLEALKALVEAD